MIRLRELFKIVASHAQSLPFFVGVLNEDALLFIVLLASQSDASFWTVALFGFLGMMTHDTLIFFMTLSPLMQRFGRYINRSTSTQGLVKIIERLGRRHYFIPLLLSKFIYGTRTPLVIYASNKERRFFPFIFWNALAAGIWCGILFPIAWIAGQGFSRLLFVFRGIEKILGLILIAALLVYLVNVLVKRMILSRKMH